MGFIYYIEKKIFDEDMERQEKFYRKHGMDPEAIEAMKEYDYIHFKKERIIRLHEQPISSTTMQGIEDESIYVNKELQRISKAAVEAISSRDIYYTFPAVMARNSTVLVLKGPKTKTSVRRVYLPKTVAEMLVERKRQLDEYLEFFGDEFYNYNLVFCNNCGRPMEGQVINRALSKLIREHDLPKIVFHSLRHTSTTYKLKLSGGDIKAVQGDTGHAQASMVTERYAHILDDDRKRNAERFEAAFYSSSSAEIGATEISEDSISGDESAVSDETDEREALLKMLEQSPEMMALLKAMLEKKNT